MDHNVKLMFQPCTNPDCLYLHEVGSQEDSFTKDEIISAYTRCGNHFAFKIAVVLLVLDFSKGCLFCFVFVFEIEIHYLIIYLSFYSKG